MGTAVKTPYGPKSEVKYADPGYRDNIARYPIDTEPHVRAALAYINMPKNAGKYTREQLKEIKARIHKAAKEYGIEVADDQDEMAMGGGYMAKPSASTLLAGAAAPPMAPPSAWFSDPGLAGPTRLTIADDGHVFGHLAQWRVCHVGVGNSCVMAPKSRLNYNLFKVGTVRCDDGTEVQVGKITLGTGHANAQWGVMPSREHYDNTGWSAAVVSVGEDRHGIWVNGALTSNMTPERIVELRAAALSGDWRTVNGNLELIAALAVNNPGFPIYREANGRAFSLVSVGVLGADDEISGEFSMSDEADVVDAEEAKGEQAERFATLQEITGDWDTHKRQKRLAQLAALDEERETVSAPKKPSNRMFLYADRDAKLEVLQED